jgi:hypothetical protein
MLVYSDWGSVSLDMAVQIVDCFIAGRGEGNCISNFDDWKNESDVKQNIAKGGGRANRF